MDGLTCSPYSFALHSLAIEDMNGPMWIDDLCLLVEDARVFWYFHLQSLGGRLNTIAKLDAFAVVPVPTGRSVLDGRVCVMKVMILPVSEFTRIRTFSGPFGPACCADCPNVADT